MLVAVESACYVDKPLMFFGSGEVGEMACQAIKVACKPIGRAWAGDPTQIHAPARNKPFRAGASHFCKPKMTLSAAAKASHHQTTSGKNQGDTIAVAQWVQNVASLRFHKRWTPLGPPDLSGNRRVRTFCASGHDSSIFLMAGYSDMVRQLE
ncbi:hypothetical protein C8R44DRAFT_726600 [Mycena epipterygia]|nr:hypothetical protein C8R44DRAFT_726600 [Mycena epipterygia]